MSSSTKSAKSTINQQIVWRGIITVAVVILAALGYWNWAWLTLAVGAFNQLANVAMALIVSQIRPREAATS
jgi:hypothetical protein